MMSPESLNGRRKFWFRSVATWANREAYQRRPDPANALCRCVESIGDFRHADAGLFKKVRLLLLLLFREQVTNTD